MVSESRLTEQIRGVEVGQARIACRALQGDATEPLQDPARATLTRLPGGFHGGSVLGGDDAQQRLPVLTIAHHHRLAGVGTGSLPQALDEGGIDQRHIAGQYQHIAMACQRQPGAYPREGAVEIIVVVLHQTIGVGRVALHIAVAGNDQIVGQRTHQSLYVLDQRLAVPVDQTLVAAAHALALAAGQQQDRTRGQGAGSGHDGLNRGSEKECCDITPACFLYNWIEPMKAKADTPFVPLNIAVLTVSDTRTRETDTSGQMFVDRLSDAGHSLIERVLLKDDLYKIRAQVATWIADDQVQVVLITGGTGFTGRDSTPEAVACLLDKQVDGFGELFRQISVPDIGTSTIQSRALAGLANGTLVCCLPGSTNAVRTGWDGILAQQLDNRFRPCNFVPHLKQAEPCATRG